MCAFKIDAGSFSWINGEKDDPDDLCLHGNVKVQIGKTVMEYFGTVSATGLYLLKTLTEDKLMEKYGIQMVPCCGHFLIANKDLSAVTISGCDSGLDWSVVHENGGVKLVLPTGEEQWVPMNEYRAEVLRFADRVEAYYKQCKPKNLPEDEFTRNGYLAFWNEWHRRYAEAASAEVIL